MCSTENKETRLEKTPGSVRAPDKGRQNKREQKNTKPKKKRKGLHKGRKGDFKGFIICEFASSWTIGRKFANYEQGGKEGKQRRTRKRKKTKKNEEKEGDNGISNSLLKFRKWSKNGLKAQKLLAQGIALGKIAISKAPCKGKILIYCLDF